MKLDISVYLFEIQVTCCQTDNCNNAAFVSTSDATSLKTRTSFVTILIVSFYTLF